MSDLHHVERPPRGEPDGLLVLHHGRGSDERDLIGLADILDPAGRLHVVSVRAPLTLPGAPGYHWYAVRQVGHPDPSTFAETWPRLTAFHDELGRRVGVGPARTVLGGFSQGAVMSYALGLGEGRPPVAGLLCFSGFIPAVEGFATHLDDRRECRVFIAHGRLDPVIGVEFARAARAVLEPAGLPVSYHEGDFAHNIDPRQIPDAVRWLEEVLPPPV